MKGVKKTELPASFVRGMIATGMLAALQDGRRGAGLLRSALLGGTALTTAVGVENLLFDKEFKLGKKKKGKNKDWAVGLNRAELATLLGRPAPAGLAALTGSQQFLAGALLGAAAAYVLSDEALRAKLIKGGMQLYAGLAGGLEEIKEQMADIQAELAVGQQDAG